MSISSSISPNCVLFDLDGTLIDTAPDMVNALNTVLKEEEHSIIPFDEARCTVSHGSAAMIKFGFGDQLSSDFERCRDRFLDIYAENIYMDSKLFAGMEKVLDFLENADIRWGIVTNKPTFYTEKLLALMGLDQRACSVVCGDTLTVNKPAPEPMWHAIEQCGCLAENTIYIGDAQRDIEAGRNANMTTLLAKYGYITDNDDIVSWAADDEIDHAEEIIDKVKRRFSLI